MRTNRDTQLNSQGGMTLIGLIFVVSGLATLAVVLLKVVPAYIDYYTVQHTLENMLQANTNLSANELRNTFARRLDVNSIRDLSAKDLYISRADGELTLIVPIDRDAPLAGGLSLNVHLEAKASAPIRD